MIYWILLTLFLSPSLGLSQEVIYLGDVKDSQNVIETLDEDYADAGHPDTSIALFSMKELSPAWREILTDLNTHLIDQGLNWESPLKIWNRIYFSKDGSIEYYVYNFRNEALDKRGKTSFMKRLKNLLRKPVST